MPYTTVINFTAGAALAAADLNSNFDNLDYLNAKINSQIQIGAGSMIPSVTKPASYGSLETTTYKNDFVFMDFPDSGDYSYAEFNLVLPADYDGGTITALFHWTANSTSTNSVIWGMAAVALTDNQALDTDTGTGQTVTDANKSTAYYLNITAATSAITIAGTPAAGKLAHFRVYRASGVAGDDLAVTARLLSVVITYTRS